MTFSSYSHQWSCLQQQRKHWQWFNDPKLHYLTIFNICLIPCFNQTSITIESHHIVLVVVYTSLPFQFDFHFCWYRNPGLILQQFQQLPYLLLLTTLLAAAQHRCQTHGIWPDGFNEQCALCWWIIMVNYDTMVVWCWFNNERFPRSKRID